eukprot:scaffold65219_cov60-Phaeocystis_antarctica.AAC.3
MGHVIGNHGWRRRCSGRGAPVLDDAVPPRRTQQHELGWAGGVGSRAADHTLRGGYSGWWVFRVWRPGTHCDF